MLMNAQIYIYKRARAKALRHERTPPKNEKINQLLHPFASITGFDVKWHDKWISKLDEHEIPM